MGGESKLVVFGTGGVGKSAITVKFVMGKFVEVYDPSICDKYRKQETVDGETEIIEVVDTAGQEQYKPMRTQYYQKGEGFIAVYSITDRGSMGEVEKLRDDVLEERGSTWVPMVLVGNKRDLEAQRKVTTSEGEALAKNWFGEGRGIPFFETSAKEDINITETFHQIVRELRAQKARGGAPAPTAPAGTAPTQPVAAPVADTTTTPILALPPKNNKILKNEKEQGKKNEKVRGKTNEKEQGGKKKKKKNEKEEGNEKRKKPRGVCSVM